MEETKKSSLNEAKVSFEEIKKFALDSAKQEFQKEIEGTIEKILKETLSIEVDDDKNIILKTDEKIVELKNDGEVETIEKDEEVGLTSDEDNEPIEIENIEEMIKLEEEQPAVAPEQSLDTVPQVTPEATPLTASEEATSETSTEELVQKIANDIAELVEKTIDQKTGEGKQTTDQAVDVDYIDDETTSQEQPPVQPAVEQPVKPAMEEDELLELSMNEISKEDKNTEENFLEIDVPEKGNVEEKFFEIDDTEEECTACADEKVFEFDVPEDVEEIDEMLGQSNTVHRSLAYKEPNEKYRTSRMKINENNNKAQHESKLDELKKENESLKKSLNESAEVVKNFKSSFIDLRKQFDEMQTFNAKLAYANKIFASGGLSTSEKTKIAEDFDRTQNADDAKKLYDKIIKENRMVVSKDNVSKIKSPITNTVKSKDAVFESAEIKRNKELAGINKTENNLL